MEDADQVLEELASQLGLQGDDLDPKTVARAIKQRLKAVERGGDAEIELIDQLRTVNALLTNPEQGLAVQQSHQVEIIQTRRETSERRATQTQRAEQRIRLRTRRYYIPLSAVSAATAFVWAFPNSQGSILERWSPYVRNTYQLRSTAELWMLTLVVLVALWITAVLQNRSRLTIAKLLGRRGTAMAALRILRRDGRRSFEASHFEAAMLEACAVELLSKSMALRYRTLLTTRLYRRGHVIKRAVDEDQLHEASEEALAEAVALGAVTYEYDENYDLIYRLRD